MPRTRKNSLPSEADEATGLQTTIPLPNPNDLTPAKATNGRGRKKQSSPTAVVEIGALEVTAIAKETPSPAPEVAPKNAVVAANEQPRFVVEPEDAAKKTSDESGSLANEVRRELAQARELHQAGLDEFKTAQANFHSFLQEFLEVRKLTQSHLAEVKMSRETLDAFHKVFSEYRTTAKTELQDLRAELQQERQLAQKQWSALTDIQQQFQGCSTKISEASQQMDELTTHVQQSVHELVELRDQVYRLREQLQEPIRELAEKVPSALQSVQATRTELNSMNEDVQSFREEFGRIVVASRQLLSVAELEPIQDHLRELELQLPKTERQVHEIQAELTHVSEDLRETRTAALQVKEQVQHVPALAESPDTKTEEPAHPYRLGLTIDSAILIAEVFNDSPAEQAGLLQGDVIQSVNGIAVQSIAQFRECIDDLKDDEEVVLLTNQSGVERTVMVQLTSHFAEEFPAENRSKLGLIVDSCVIVVDVEPDSPSSAGGIASGDIVVAVDSEPIATAAQLRDAVLAHVAGDGLVLSVLRQGQRLDLTAPPI